MFSRDQLKRAASLTQEDFVQLGKCRRPHNRLGFAYQVAFVRLIDRFPQQRPFELFEKLVCFNAAQLGLDAEPIELYRKWQPTISEHQQTIAGYLGLRALDDAEVGARAGWPVLSIRVLLRRRWLRAKKEHGPLEELF
jgi:hypothetical protein